MAEEITDAHQADCEECEWSRVFSGPKGEEEATIAWVCHMVIKHPTQYHRDTGKDPAVVKEKYKEYIEAFRRHL